MANNNYFPEPIDTSDVIIPEDLNSLMEQIARNVHEVWAKGRLDDGWTYGAERNDAEKKHPCLVDYDELPESEKDYDRRTAMGTLKLILKLGWKLEKILVNMDIRRTINIFLASSEEMENDRNAFGNLVRRLNGICEKQGIHIELFEWEDYDAAYNGCRKQDEYNEKVRSCDMFIALFHIKAGQWTIEEFDVASEEYRRTGQKPKVYVYCRELNSGEFESEELKNFKTRLFDEMGHYWSVYSNKDSMQLHFVMQLMLLESGGGMGKLKVDNGRVMFMDNPIASMDKLHFAADNEDYRAKQNEINELHDEIEGLQLELEEKKTNLQKKKEKLEKHPDDEDYREDYEAVQKEVEKIIDKLQPKLNKYNKKKEEFVQYQDSLLDTAKRISCLQGERITDRMRRAMEAFEAGKVREANVILDEAERDADNYLEDYMQSREITAIKRENVIKSIEELLLKASTVMVDESVAIEDRISKVAELYAKVDMMADVVDYDNEKYAKLLYDYATFLYDYAKYEDALKVVERQIEKAPSNARSYNVKGKILFCIDKYQEALETYEKALKVLEESNYTDTSLASDIYNNMGAVYNRIGNYEAAKERANGVLVKEGTLESAKSLVNIANGSLLYSGSYEKALEYYEKALEIEKESLGEDSVEVAITYRNMGEAYRFKDDQNKSMDSYMAALSIFRKKIGDTHPETALTYGCIGVVYMNLHEYEKALEYTEMGMKIREEILGEYNTRTAESYFWMGEIYSKQSKIQDNNKALEYYHKAKDIREKEYGASHFETKAVCNSIVEVYASQGEVSKAIDFIQKCKDDVFKYNCIGDLYYEKEEYDSALEYYKMALKSLNIENRYAAEIYDNIAFVYLKKEDSSKSLEYFNKALEIYEKNFDKECDFVAVSYSNIGYLYYGRDDYKSLECFNKALEIYEKVCGKECYYPNVVYVTNRIGSLYLDQENYSKSLEYYSKALEIGEKIFGKESHDVAVICYNIGYVYERQGYYSQAIEFYIKALEIDEKVLGQYDLSNADYCKKIYCLFFEMKNYSDALVFAEKVLKIHVKNIGVEHSETATDYMELGLIYLYVDDCHRAMSCFNTALKIKETIGSDELDLAEVYRCMGITYLKESIFDKSIEYYTKAFYGFMNAYGDECQDVAGIYDKIAYSFDMLGDYDMALVYYNKALKIYQKVNGEEHDDTQDVRSKIEEVKSKMSNAN